MICYAFPLAHEAELLLKHCTQKESFMIDGLVAADVSSGDTVDAWLAKLGLA